jgi:hypothetical protein
VLALNETAELRTPLPDQPMGLNVGDKGETDALVGAPHALLPISTLTLTTHYTAVRKKSARFPQSGLVTIGLRVLTTERTQASAGAMRPP